MHSRTSVQYKTTTMEQIDLSIKIGDLLLPNPIMTASGTYGYGHEYAPLTNIDRLGAIIVKGTTLEPRQGNAYPRMAETPSGMLNAVGLQNPGVEYFISEIYPTFNSIQAPIIVNVSGSKPEDYAAVCRRLANLDKIAAVEINISCPNVKQGGMAFGTTCAGAKSVVKLCRKEFPGTMIVKLSPNVTDITEIAKTVEGEGADSVSLINTMLGMAIDVEKRSPVLSTITGGLSGPAIKPIALRMVWQVARAVSIPVIGLGGIMSGKDAMEFILAGATAVQLGTVNFVDPNAGCKAIDWITEYCKRHNVNSIKELIGSLKCGI